MPDNYAGPNEENILDAAIQLATRYHAGQRDKSGRPYLGHLERVATLVRQSGGTWVQEAAAWLHDIVEDTGAEISSLSPLLPEAIVRIVDAMTHWHGQSNEDYWRQVRDHPPAVLVKLCDIYDNLSPARMCYMDEPTQRRLRLKYAKAMQAVVGEQ